MSATRVRAAVAPWRPHDERGGCSVPSRGAAIEQQQNPFYGHKLLLDGQQRLTSLTAVVEDRPVEARGRKEAGCGALD